MGSEYVELSFWQLVIAAALLLTSAGISLALQLGLEKSLLIASIRTVVQLLVLSQILRWVFSSGAWYFVTVLATVMTLVAGWSAVGRVQRGFDGLLLDSVIAVWLSSWCVTAIALTAVIGVEPWYKPQYAIPLLGMVLHNTLNGISLGMDRFTRELMDKRADVDTLLALGATRWEAALDAMREAIRTGLIPTINAMMVVGIVSIPGMMTGQMLAGVDPLQAGLYQMMIMFLIAASSSVGTMGAVLLGFHRLFNREHQFLPSRISQR